jgi:hypothetical protein
VLASGTQWPDLAMRRILHALAALSALALPGPWALPLAAPATVPDQFPTIQQTVDAVQNDHEPGEVVVNSNGIFDARVWIRQSVTIRVGDGYTPILTSSTVDRVVQIYPKKDSRLPLALEVHSSGLLHGTTSKERLWQHAFPLDAA